ncbi:MAG TPA: TonB-dependent receptor plug domain-containing protein, partial [Segetibacter sp.]
MKKIALTKIKYVFMLYLLLILSPQTWAQATQVKGKVTDENRAGVAGVSVLLKGTSSGTGTDANGNFSINVPNLNGTLVLSSVGFTTQEVAINNRATVNVTLTSGAGQALGEVVVVGYGSQLRKQVTGAVQTINNKELKDIPVSQVTQKLQGRLAGVQINQTTGKPGQGMNVRIRGQFSISAGSDPLYVIDGFPITGSIGALNPDEIQDISILKDAASTSLYGSRAANGVVLITTKKGKKGQTNVSFNTFAGIQQVPERGRIQMMDAVEFAQFKKEYYEDQNAASPNPVADP